MKKSFLILVLILSLGALFSLSSSARDIPQVAKSRLCKVTTRICVSNINNELTIKDEQLLEACKSCCTTQEIIAMIGGCTNRCQKKCESVYRRATSGRR